MQQNINTLRLGDRFEGPPHHTVNMVPTLTTVPHNTHSGTLSGWQCCTQCDNVVYREGKR